jgi:hypothetical protein
MSTSAIADFIAFTDRLSLRRKPRQPPSRQRNLHRRMDEQNLLDQFERIEDQSIDERLWLVCDRFPDIWKDAESFVTGRRFLPWDFGAGFDDDATTAAGQVSDASRSPPASSAARIGSRGLVLRHPRPP